VAPCRTSGTRRRRRLCGALNDCARNYTSRPRPPVANEPNDPDDPELPLDPEDPLLEPDELELPPDDELLLDELPNPAPLDELLDDELLLDEVVIPVGCVGESSHPTSSDPAIAPPDSINRTRRRSSRRFRRASSCDSSAIAGLLR
jgi:hypothetical protein